MTYNQIIKRMSKICLAHKQVRTFKKGLVSDFLTDKKTDYAAVFAQDNSGSSISLLNKQTTVAFRLFFLDLTHLSSDANENEQDVISDMLSVAQDILAKFSVYNDWKIGSSSPVQIIVEDSEDILAGVVVDISIGFMYTQNVCAVPSDSIPIDVIIPTDMNVYDITYESDMTEGTVLDIEILHGKKILLVTRESQVVYKTSEDPDTSEYVWNGTTIQLGLTVNTEQRERFLILYRNL